MNKASKLFLFLTIVYTHLSFSELRNEKHRRIQFESPSWNDFESTSPNTIRYQIESWVHGRSFSKMDPTLDIASDFRIRLIQTKPATTIRIQPLINNIQVQGADRILQIFKEGFSELTIENDLGQKTDFILSVEQAIQQASKRIPVLQSIKKQVLPVSFPVWLSYRDGLHAAFQVPVIKGRLEQWRYVWIDAEQGRILKSEPIARFLESSADLFKTPPNASIPLSQQTQPALLENLVSNSQGDILRGLFFQVNNCCKRYLCPDGSSSCAETERLCADNSAISLQNKKRFLIPSKLLGFENETSVPPYLNFLSVACLKRPSAKLGEAPIPIDDSSELSEREPFALFQSYYSVTLFFKHIRSLLSNPAWCLRNGCGMECDETGNPIMVGMEPKHPFSVFVNQLLPVLDIDKKNSNIANQIAQGKGSEDNPVIIQDLERIDNAAFIPCINPEDIQLAPEDILGDYLKPYDQLLIFQGNRDLSYDHSVVFHEFMHATTQTLVPDLNTIGANAHGSHVEPGALNEAWSDYFATSLLNSPLIGSYGTHDNSNQEIALRNLQNTNTCPGDIMGEVHEDSLIFSGALWELRAAVMDELGDNALQALDSTLLSALAQSVATETFEKQGNRIITLLESQSLFGASWSNKARSIFQSRGVIGCNYIHLLTVAENNTIYLNKKDALFLLPKTYFGFETYAPPTMQFAINLPKGASSFKIHWSQLYRTSDLLELPSGGKPNGLKAIITEEYPVVWSYGEKDPIAKVNNKALENPTLITAAPAEDGWKIDQSIPPDPCKQRVFYVSLLGSDYETLLRNISVDIQTDADSLSQATNCPIPNASEQNGCSCSQSNSQKPFLDLLMLLASCLGLAAYSRKKRMVKQKQPE